MRRLGEKRARALDRQGVVERDHAYAVASLERPELEPVAASALLRRPRLLACPPQRPSQLCRAARLTRLVDVALDAREGRQRAVPLHESRAGVGLDSVEAAELVDEHGELEVGGELGHLQGDELGSRAPDAGRDGKERALGIGGSRQVGADDLRSAAALASPDEDVQREGRPGKRGEPVDEGANELAARHVRGGRAGTPAALRSHQQERVPATDNLKCGGM